MNPEATAVEAGKSPQISQLKKAKNTKNQAVSKSSRAGLEFPVGRVHRHMKSRFHGSMRIAGAAAVYTAAILEYVVAEVLELAGNASKDLKMKRISPRHLQLSIRGDEDLDSLVKATIAGGGVIPHINKALLNPKPSVMATTTHPQQN
ncbi:hypothetical protein SUGI_0105950 [Cryptomeria japonica]|uniref:uncharacterized protein LOC131046205 n=1 Tax=Cryptomeria japonica TaxID=3369 RepID=UPI002408CD82|nr:uncharacterized protein LOC131046205 [Cryptomeria japonica]GLJ09304.1 hypothetical protein SUGI_0105950 [Cryptomeria japonica]